MTSYISTTTKIKSKYVWDKNLEKQMQYGVSSKNVEILNVKLAPF
jgi:uncharacterized protein involved in tolerance to divalent cations